MMMVRHIALALAGLLVAGCAARQFEVPETHPANPAAAEAPLPPGSATLKPESVNQPRLDDGGAPIAGHVHGQQGQPAAVAPYQCPMHPEVRSDKPGRCPKCGMSLQVEGGRE